jgi:dephospho-CoA kinase
VLRVGLTGGIGSGKSTVAERLAELGAVLIDADVVAREVVEPGTPGFDAVVGEFGPGVLTSDGTLDRPALGKIVFADSQRREALNAIVHPLVHRRRIELVEQAPADAVVVEDIPLLVENGLAPAYHLVIVVHAAEEERVRRLVANRGTSADDAWARVRAQARDAARLAAADVWLDNSGSVDDVLRQIDEVWRRRLLPFEKNIRAHAAAPGPGTTDLVPYNADWPHQAERLIARIAAAVGESARRVEHVGGTSVPGSLASDSIDVLVALRPSVNLDQVREALTAAGFPASESSANVHSTADPGQSAVAWVYRHDDRQWRERLLLRDWLRATPEELTRYNASKRDWLDAGDASVATYIAGDRNWCNSALAHAESWAAQSGWVP